MTTDNRRTAVWPTLLCAAAGAALFQFWGNATHGYIPTNSLFYWWVFQWVNPDSETEHAWLILALAVFLAVRNLRAETSAPAPDSRRAAVALGTGLALHAVGFVADQPRLSIIALLLYLWGIFALGGGRRWGRALMFPVAYMIFAVPLSALDTFGFWLQMWVVQAGAGVAHLLGIGVIRNGTQLFGPDGRYQYDVVAACSGVRSLMALTALSLFIGYLWFRPIWLRGLLLLASLPLVYVGNVVRIASIIVAAQAGGQKRGDLVHDVMGFAVFAIVLGGVIGLAEILLRRQPGWARAGGGGDRQDRLAPPPPWLTPVTVAVAVAFLTVGDAAFLTYRSSLPNEDRPGVMLAADGTNPRELPTYLGSQWMGREIEPDPIERTILPPDTGFSRKLYQDLDHPGQNVLLSIVLSGRDRTSIHRPELCLVGQGWSIDGSGRHRFAYPQNPGAGFDATVLGVHRFARGPAGPLRVPELVVYWFVGDDQVIASQGRRMLYDAWMRVAHGRAPRWAYVLLKTGAADGADAALARIQSVLNSALPSFQPPTGAH